MASLKKLNLFRNSEISVERILQLKSLQYLQHLNLGGFRISNEEKCNDVYMAAVGSLSNLVELDLRRNYNITDTGLSHISSLIKLKYLNISYCFKITSSGLGVLRNLPLRHLDINGIDMTDIELYSLSFLHQLEHLDMCLSEEVTNEGLNVLKNLPLQKLGIADYEDYHLSVVGTMMTSSQTLE